LSFKLSLDESDEAEELAFIGALLFAKKQEYESLRYYQKRISKKQL
jgi:hypothetical protein